MENFSKKLQARLMVLVATGKLFRSTVSGQVVWDTYLNSFEDGADPIFRDPESSVHNCNHCKNFIRRYGNIVAVDENNNIITLWDIQDAGEEYQPVCDAISGVLTTSGIRDVFFETWNELNSLPYESCNARNEVFRLGVAQNVKRYTKEEAEKFGVVKADEIRTFNHAHVDLPKEFVNMGGNSIEAIMGQYRDAKNVFQRAMEEIPLDTLELVRDLINQESLLDGKTHLSKVETFIPLKKQYDQLSPELRDNWCWVTSYGLHIAKFKNELIGVLCSELAQGEDLNTACQNWNKRVDPANYMKAKAPITQRQIDEARKFVEENGFEESFNRRFATLADIDVSEIIHYNVGDGKVKNASMFDNVKSAPKRHKRSQFDNVEEVTIEKFMKDILPHAGSIEAFVQNRHEGNFVTLTTANDPKSAPIFKWSNNFSKTFNGNLAGKSMIKEAVKTRGGSVTGDLRFSIMWADGNNDNSDLDAWCETPSGFKIGFSSKREASSGGNLDVDIQTPQSYGSKNIVENITFPLKDKMRDGEYFFWVNQFAERNSQGFTAEIEFDGEIYTYSHPGRIANKHNVPVAKVTLKKGQFSIEHVLPEMGSSSREIWGIETNNFQKVNLVCLSPNHWGENNVGNKYYLFMIDGCKSPQSVRSFHNEDLSPQLAQHRKVMEVLGNTNMLEPAEKQLAGLGFNATVRDELIVKLGGNFKRVVKIKF